MLIALVVSAGILLFLCLFLIAYYNKLVRGRNLVEEAWSGISVQLKRRHDLIPSLVNTVRGYAQHESAVLREVTEARAYALAASSGAVQDVAQAENVLNRALRSLFAVSENYPQLRASENFLQLQEQLNSKTQSRPPAATTTGRPAIRMITSSSSPATWLPGFSALTGLSTSNWTARRIAAFPK